MHWVKEYKSCEVFVSCSIELCIMSVIISRFDALQHWLHDMVLVFSWWIKAFHYREAVKCFSVHGEANEHFSSLSSLLSLYSNPKDFDFVLFQGPLAYCICSFIMKIYIVPLQGYCSRLLPWQGANHCESLVVVLAKGTMGTRWSVERKEQRSGALKVEVTKKIGQSETQQGPLDQNNDSVRDPQPLARNKE